MIWHLVINFSFITQEFKFIILQKHHHHSDTEFPLLYNEADNSYVLVFCED
jgi:hypothetical protein